ncbi:hypothetical protein Poli38472_014725 [Pythium oligandrum]|uniref:Protein kinase domain-containing protein n=1 Tax=Pythium oligandrum TaxID=41045 RepID=A0A8K1C1Y4_PYTOL|nr:hypothetical protein Poli38472_014725 [Pythium oligandrum]|eukprot:TMW54954.1 hypothetical protein Poli38472_014725 [Pythium oligandrum]
MRSVPSEPTEPIFHRLLAASLMSFSPTRSIRNMRTATRVLALAFTASLGLHAASAAECTSLKQNVLTSVGCPAQCVDKNAPCVLYASQDTPKCVPMGSSGPCLKDAFKLSDASEECDVTYQCLDTLVDNKIHKWFLTLETTTSANKVATAFVTQVANIEYPDDVLTIQLTGGVATTPKGTVKNVLLDSSFFQTPPSVTSFFVTDVNLQKVIEDTKTVPSTWQAVAFNNANLNKVPTVLSNLTLRYVEFTMNYFTSFPEMSDPVMKAFESVTTLKLQYNELTDFTTKLPAVETLNLTGNPLGKVPDVIFELKTLKKLSMRQCNLSNIQLDDAQYTFLDQLDMDVDISVTDCGDGFAPRNLSSGAGQVCMPSTESSGGGNGVAIGVGVGAAVLVVCIAAFLGYRRRKNKEIGGITRTGKSGTATDDTDNLTIPFDPDSEYGSSSIWSDPDLLAVRVDFRDVEPIKLLSRGGFGEVWLGLYMNENVAIKRLLSDKKTMTDALAFAQEIKVMARLDHPKIVRFIGVAWSNATSIQAITEFMDCGDLRSLLDSSRASSLTWANLKCQIAIDIADALVYLHTLNPKLIHRDLKSRNVLIDAHTGAKLSDFGISRDRASDDRTMTAGVGTARWIAPEVILSGHYTEFADIYSFGVVLSELDSCKTPFHDATNTNGAKMPDVTILQLVSAGKLQPSFTDSCPEPIVRLARACLSFDPAQRPSAIHVSYELRKILKEVL